MLTRLLFPRRHAQRTWERARENYLAMKARGDTRAQHEAMQSLKAATFQRLRTGA